MASEGRESLPVQAGNQIIDLIVKEVLSCIETTRIRTGDISIDIGRGVNDSTVQQCSR
ncbi:MAG: hypothetical protein M1282_10190 [Chloroflexi bacterium]|nr:hypothetical protein [Chloroflexota bacterium]